MFSIAVKSIMVKHRVVPGRVIIDHSKDTVYRFVANPTDKTVVLHKGSDLAIATPIDTYVLYQKRILSKIRTTRQELILDRICKKTNLDDILEGPLPEHLQEERSGDDLTNEEIA